MTLTTALIVTANATQAKAELRVLQTETSKTATSTSQLGTAAKQASTDLSVEQQRVVALEAAMAALKTELGSVTAQNSEMKTSMAGLKAELDALNARHDKVKTSATGAGGAVGNLAAQFNDVGMMIAAGQSPMQMAIQQGSQITQVIGPMGAAGALNALKTAAMSLLNPVNLVTYAALAGGAALIQWAMGAGDAKVEAKSTEDQIKDLESAVSAYSASATKAITPTAELAGKYGTLASSAKEAFEAIAAADRQTALATLADTQAAIAATFGAFNMPAAGEVASPLEETLQRIRTELGATGEQAVVVQQSLEALANAEGPNQIAIAAEAARDALLAAGVAANDPLVQGINAAWSQAIELQTTTEDVAAAAFSVRDAADAAANAMGRIGSAAQSSYGAVSALAAKAWEAVNARVAAEKQAVIDRGNAYGQYANAGGIDAIARAGNDTFAVAAPKTYTFGNSKISSSGSGSGSGRSASAAAANKEKDAVSELIKKLQEEQELLRETDPVKQEMLKQRKALAGASDTERAKVEALIRAEIQLKSVREATDFFANNSLDLLQGLVAGGDAATSAMKKLANSILDAALQALWLGKGPLAGLFGTSGNIFGNLFGGLFGGSVQTRAEGGMIFGEGSGRADKVPVWASAGEFMVNQRSTARYRPLLERMNSGQPIPGFANGGMIGGGRSSGWGASGGGERKMEQHIHVYGAKGNSEISEMVAAGVQQGIELHDREVLPFRVKDVLQNQRVSGR